jgi:hypothetical protein
MRRKAFYPSSQACINYVNSKVATGEIYPENVNWEIQCCRAAFNEAPPPAPIVYEQRSILSFMPESLSEIWSEKGKEDLAKYLMYALYVGGGIFIIKLLMNLTRRK